jgi:hypothetical protein
MSLPRTIRLGAVLLALGAVISGCSAPTRNSGMLQNAAWRYSTDGGLSFVSDAPVAPAGKQLRFVAECRFEAPPVDAPSITLSHALPDYFNCEFMLNGTPLRGPMPQMKYRTFTVDSTVLHPGVNLLQATVTVRNLAEGGRTPFNQRCYLAAALTQTRSEDLRIVEGPVHGWAGPNWFTVSCRTNFEGLVRLRYGLAGAGPEAMEETLPSRGVFHRFRLSAPVQGAYAYEIEAVVDGKPVHTVAGTARTLPAPGDNSPLLIAFVGDNRTRTAEWAKVASAIASHKPSLVVHDGDMTTSGVRDWGWLPEFLAPARRMLADAPFYCVTGNHEGNSRMLREYFWMGDGDGRSTNWAQQIGPVLLVGIDGMENWARDSANEAWLDSVLSSSEAEYIFAVDHYFAWSSGRHGRNNAQGEPAEREVSQARNTIMPLLVKYKASALISGHDHCYERSEPGGDVAAIIIGGGGAPLYAKAPAAAVQNPHSVAFASELCYGLLEVRNGRCVLTVLGPGGNTIDRREFMPRSRRADVMSPMLDVRPPEKKPAARNPASAPASQPAGAPA